MEPAAILCITRTAIRNRDFLSKKGACPSNGQSPNRAVARDRAARDRRRTSTCRAFRGSYEYKVAPTITVACSKHDPSRRERYHPDGNCPSVNQSI
jgi:hypothetical protein